MAVNVSAPEEGRPPQSVQAGLWLFAPNRDTQGGSSWLCEVGAGDLLIDVPAFTTANLAMLQERCRRRSGWIVLTGREGHGRCRRWQEALGWPVLVQEQEAYLLPGVASLTGFAESCELLEGVRLLWTPGPSPGACVVHARLGGSGSLDAVGAIAGKAVGEGVGNQPLDGLFCGRLLVPLAPQRIAPLRRRGCFHWPRQLRSVEHLRQWLPPGSPDWIASGAALGALQGEKLVRSGADQLARLDLVEALQAADPGLSR
ncbi:MAG: MBL fold metallo-hydrolase [Cyanobacteria bacterium]|nr:MBL fold metallo-hydrolase [Cyanobacteriota bacterium]